MSFSSDASSASAAVDAAAAAQKKLNLEKATNFMKQYRDPHSRELKKLSANQFMDVWSHYDKDGEFARIKIITISSSLKKYEVISRVCT
jgi:hypothetical protein